MAVLSHRAPEVLHHQCYRPGDEWGGEARSPRLFRHSLSGRRRIRLPDLHRSRGGEAVVRPVGRMVPATGQRPARVGVVGNSSRLGIGGYHRQRVSSEFFDVVWELRHAVQVGPARGGRCFPPRRRRLSCPGGVCLSGGTRSEQFREVLRVPLLLLADFTCADGSGAQQRSPGSVDDVGVSRRLPFALLPASCR